MKNVATTDRSQAPAAGRTQTVSPISWIPNHELDAHEWAAAGRRIGAVGRCIQWLLGDWIAYGNTKFGERYARASRITGYDAQTLMNMVYVASRFSISRRRENLSWSHHETLAALEPEEQDHWLDEAAAQRWSVADLRLMLRTSRKKSSQEEAAASEASAEAPAQLEESPQLVHTATSATRVVMCPHCGENVPLVAT